MTYELNLSSNSINGRRDDPRSSPPSAIFFWTRLGNLAAAANALWCTRLPARQLILSSQWTCYNRDFDINKLLPVCASFEQ